MEDKKFRRIRRMILSRVLLVPFTIIMLVCGTLVYYFAANLRKEVAANLAHIADGHRRLVEQFLRERSYDLLFAAEFNTMDELKQRERLAQVLASLQARSQAFFDLGLFDSEGNHLDYVGAYSLEGKNYKDTDWFKGVQKNKIYISDVFMGYRNIPHFIIAVSREENGKTWYLRATIDTLFFNDLVESITIGKTGEAYLINSEGIFQTRPRFGGTMMETDPDHGSYTSSANSIDSFSVKDSKGVTRLYATGRLSNTGWLLVVRQEQNDAYRLLYRAVAIAIGLIIGGGAVVVMMAFFLASGLANRLTVADMEKRQMTSQLIMAGKLAEIGEMSAAVAHEINNPLQVMKSEFAMINEQLNDMDTRTGKVDSQGIALLRDSVNQASLQVERCKQITHGLLKFSRKSEMSILPIEARPFLQDVVAMVEHRAQLEKIKIVQGFDPILPIFISDPNQLQQVFLNLLNNAFYALKDKKGGEIRIAVTVENGWIATLVADNGCGIPTENIQKIFLPFYTTKPVGQGTGLGLSTCYGIIERLGGRIEVASKVGEGTVFTIKLPVAGPPDLKDS